MRARGAALVIAASVAVGACSSSQASSPPEAHPAAPTPSVGTAPAGGTAPIDTDAAASVPPTTSRAEVATIPGSTTFPFPFPTAKPGIPVGALPGGGTADARITDNRLFLLGDSVMGTMRPGNTDEARKFLEPLGWRVTMDAVDGRFPAEANDVLRHRRNEVGQVAVILIGNNYGGDERLMGQQFDTMLVLLDGVPKVVFLTVEELRPEQAEVNTELRRVAAANARVQLVDWNRIVRSTAGVNRPDGLHLTPFGAAVLARTIADAIGPAPLSR